MPTPASLRRRSILFAAFLVTLLLAGCHCDEPRAIVPPAIATCIAQDEMGSGRFGSTAANDVAWVRQIRYFDIDAPFVYEPNTDDVAFWSKPNHPPCYDRSPQIFQGLGGPLMYLGGPGSDAAVDAGAVGGARSPYPPGFIPPSPAEIAEKDWGLTLSDSCFALLLCNARNSRLTP